MRFIATTTCACTLLLAVTAAQQPAPAPSSAALAPTGGRGLTEVHGIKVGSHTLAEVYHINHPRCTRSDIPCEHC
jgi:hypothetical protein